MARVIVRDTASELPSPATALGGLFEGDLAVVEDTDSSYYWDGSAWVALGTPGSGASFWKVMSAVSLGF